MKIRGSVHICGICGEESLSREKIENCELQGFVKPKFIKGQKIEFQHNNIWMPGIIRSIRLGHNYGPFYEISTSKSLMKLFKYIDKASAFFHAEFGLDFKECEFDEQNLRNPVGVRVDNLIDIFEKVKENREKEGFAYAIANR